MNIVRLICLLALISLSNLSIAQDNILSQFISTNDFQIDSLNKSIKHYLDTYQYDSAIIPLIQLIDYHLEDEEGTKAHSGRFQLARIYYILGWYTKAIDNLEYCQIYYKQNQINIDFVRTCHFLSLVNYKMGNLEMANYFLGQTEFEKPTSNNPVCKQEHLLLNALLHKDPDSSQRLFHIQDAIKFAKENNKNDMLIMAYEILGEYHTESYDANLACLAFQKCLGICQEINYLHHQAFLNFKIHQCLSSQEKFKDANDFLLQYIKSKDSLSRITENEALLKSEKIFANKRLREEKIELAQDKRLLELKSRRSNFTLIGLLVTVGAILLAVFLIVRFYQEKLSSSEIILRQNEQINRQKIKELENSIKLNNLESMIQGQEEERERIAKDLHDSLGGLLSTIKLRYDNLTYQFLQSNSSPEISKVHNLIDEACDEVRNISHDLKPGALEELGLTEAIQDMLNRFEKDDQHIIFQTYGFNEHREFDSTTLIYIYRIVQELVNNSSKHSKANEILVQLSLNSDQLEIIIEDDGIGFDENQVKKGMGLDNIKSRVSYLKGEISVKSEPNKGTSSFIVIPFNPVIQRPIHV